ncbi:YbfN protein [Enterobacter hormaechei ATCC 49162]|nr:YbfN protein [Enterobacter hormaechei ATCC 49162]
MNTLAGEVPPAWRLHMMKKWVIVALLASGLVACAQDQAQKEDSRLKEAYSACINTAQGSPEKIEACQSVLNVLKKEKAHEQFATQESVRVMDYQACIQARKTGNDQEVAKRCDKIWDEIRNNNK